jgi:hypothetical protein
VTAGALAAALLVVESTAKTAVEEVPLLVVGSTIQLRASTAVVIGEYRAMGGKDTAVGGE